MNLSTQLRFGPQGQLDPEEEEKLWKRFLDSNRSGDIFTELVEFYLPIVIRVVKKISIRVQSRIEPRELLGSGVLGLNKAIERFSPERGIPFVQYSIPRIRGAILDELRQRDPLTRSQRSSVRKVYQAVSEFVSEQERLPDQQEIGEKAGMTAEDAGFFLGLGATPVNLEDEFQDGCQYMDVIADERSINPSDAVEQTIAIEHLRDAIKKLDTRDQQLIYFRHHEEMTVKEIAAVFEISPGRVSQLYNAVIIKLRSLMQVDMTFHG